MKGVASVLRHLLTGGLLVALDFLVFWMLDQGRHLVKRDIVARGETARLTGHRVCRGSGNCGDGCPPSSGHGGGAGERLRLRLGHLQGPGGGV